MRRRNRKVWKKAAKAVDRSDKCVTKWCRNKRAEKYTSYKRKDGTVGKSVAYLRHCWKCRAKIFRQRHPAAYVLNMLRHSARKRKLPFSITLAEFKLFCRRTHYLQRRGNQPGDLTIDRIDWNKGYFIENLRVLTHAENSEQGADNRTREERGADNTDDGTDVYVEPVDSDEPF